MTLVDDLRADIPERELSRRKALSLLTGAAFALAGGGTVITTIQYLHPNVLFEPPSKVRIGAPEFLALGTLLVLNEYKLYVARTPGGVFAMSSVCTHLGCMTRYQEENDAIVCPCHGSRFDEAGQVTGGPAPRSLVRKHVALESGQVVVDTRVNVSDDFILEV
jgi:cytochrome b6-f complex iron-sulfur subunit